MLEELIQYRAWRIIDTFKHDLAPFHNIYSWKDETYACFEGLYCGKAHFGIDIIVEPQSYAFQFFVKDDKKRGKELAKSMLTKAKCLDEYVCSNDRFIKKFVFPSQEEELFKYIKSFKRKLAEVTSAN